MGRFAVHQPDSLFQPPFGCSKNGFRLPDRQVACRVAVLSHRIVTFCEELAGVRPSSGAATSPARSALDYSPTPPPRVAAAGDSDKLRFREHATKSVSRAGGRTPPMQKFNFGIRVCAGEAGCHAGESPAGRIGLFTTESWVREEAARPNPKARSRLNCPVATTVNLIE